MSDAPALSRTDYIEPPPAPPSATMGLAPPGGGVIAPPTPLVPKPQAAPTAPAAPPPAAPSRTSSNPEERRAANANYENSMLSGSPAALPGGPEGGAEPAGPKLGASKVGFVDPSNPYKLPPEAGTVIGVIRSSEGTAKQQGYQLYGGQSFVPGYEHPAKEGWQGSRTEAGPTHAAGPGQWQPGTWEDEKHKAAAAGINLDFGKGADQDWAIWDRASRIYGNATGKDLAADIKAGTVDYHVLGSEWQGLASGKGSPSLRGWGTSTSPAMRESAQALQAEAGRIRDQYHADAAELMRQANTAPEGSKERDAAIAHLREREHEYLGKYEAIASHPPALKPVDALENFGSAGTIIALLGGLFSRRHMTAALSAAGAAMQAINQNNHDKFQQEYKTWEQQSTTALNMVKLHNEEIRALIDDKKMAVDEKNARLATTFQALGMTRAADQMALGAHEKVFGEVAALERAQQTAAQARLQFQLSVVAPIEAKLIEGGMPPEEAHAEALKKAGVIPGGAAATPAKNQEAEVQNEIKRLNDASDAANPNATPAEKAEQHHKNQLAARSEMAMATAKSGTGSVSDEQASLLADQYIQGNYAVITALPRSGPSRIKVENMVAEKMRGMPDAARTITMNRLRMVEAESAARTAGRVTMQTEMYATEAEGAGREVVRTSSLFPRTEFPKVNVAIRAFEQNTGDPRVIQFGAALNSLMNAYGKMSNPTGTGIHDADKERLANIFDTSLSQRQIEDGVEQIIKEGHIMSNAAEEAQRRVLGRIAPRAPGTPDEPPRGTATPAAPAKSSGEVIQNGWRYDATTHAPLGPVQ